ncbi:hypothetical protein GOODEAATRI_004457, partial [Goodea atripinnis]
CPSNPKMGLLFVILSVIFMKGGVVRESEFHDPVFPLKKSVCSLPTEQRGWPAHTLQTLRCRDELDLLSLQQRTDWYLEYIRIPHTEPVEYEFRWGQRADMEVSKAQILVFMGQIHEQDPRSWSQQYREAHAISTPSSSQASSSNHR